LTIFVQAEELNTVVGSVFRLAYAAQIQVTQTHMLFSKIRRNF
jgi:hypothetical protein